MRRAHPLFLIAALPRSRTAWLSAFLTDGLVTCHHELIRGCANLGEYVARIHGTSAPCVGDASSGLPLYYDKVAPYLPPHRLIFILRDPEEAHAASDRFLSQECGIVPDDAQWDALEMAFNKMLVAHPAAPNFLWDSLDEPSVARQLVHAATGFDLNEERLGIFVPLRVTMIPEKSTGRTINSKQESPIMTRF